MLSRRSGSLPRHAGSAKEGGTKAACGCAGEEWQSKGAHFLPQRLQVCHIRYHLLPKGLDPLTSAVPRAGRAQGSFYPRSSPPKQEQISERARAAEPFFRARQRSWTSRILKSKIGKRRAKIWHLLCVELSHRRTGRRAANLSARLAGEVVRRLPESDGNLKPKRGQNIAAQTGSPQLCLPVVQTASAHVFSLGRINRRYLSAMSSYGAGQLHGL